MKNENGFPGLPELFFTQRLNGSAPGQIPSDRFVPGYVSPVAAVYREASAQAPFRAGTNRSGSHFDRRLPGRTGKGPREQCSQPQCASDRHPIVLSVRRSRGARPFRLDPTRAGHAGQRYEKRLIGFLTRPEIDAILAAPDFTTWTGRRDRTFLLVAVQTGLRLFEMTALCREDVVLGTGAHVRSWAKGEKSDVPHWPSSPPMLSNDGCVSRGAPPITSSFRAPGEADSVQTGYSFFWPTVQRQIHHLAGA